MAASESFNVTLDLTAHGLGVSIVGGTDAPARSGESLAPPDPLQPHDHPQRAPPKHSPDLFSVSSTAVHYPPVPPHPQCPEVPPTQIAT